MPSLTTTHWLVLLPAMTVPFFASLFYFVIFTESRAAQLIYAGTKLFTLVWPLVAVYWVFGSKMPPLELAAARHRRALPRGACVGLLIVALMFLLWFTPFRDLLWSSAPRIRQKTVQLGILEYYWIFALFLSVIHSLLEEYYWRWFVFGQLRARLPFSTAAVMASIAFAAHHVVIAMQYFPPLWGVVLGGLVGVGGAIWCWLYEKQQTLAGAWISHLIVDLGIMGFGYVLISG